MAVLLVLLPDLRSKRISLLFAPILLLEDFQPCLRFGSHELELLVGYGLDRVELADPVPLNLNSFLVGMDDVVTRGPHLVLDGLVLGPLSVVFGLVQDAAIPLEGDVLPDLDVLLGPPELLQLLLQIFDQILGEGSFAASTAAAATSCLR